MKNIFAIFQFATKSEKKLLEVRNVNFLSSQKRKMEDRIEIVDFWISMKITTWCDYVGLYEYAGMCGRICL